MDHQSALSHDKSLDLHILKALGEDNSSFTDMTGCAFNSLPNDKILDATKLKAFADDKLNVAKMMISLFDGVENTMGKGENAGYQHFLLFPQCFQEASFSRSLKYWIPR